MFIVSIHKSYIISWRGDKEEIGGSSPDSAFSLPDIGDAFQIINHIWQRRDKKLQVGVA